MPRKRLREASEHDGQTSSRYPYFFCASSFFFGLLSYGRACSAAQRAVRYAKWLFYFFPLRRQSFLRVALGNSCESRAAPYSKILLFDEIARRASRARNFGGISRACLDKSRDSFRFFLMPGSRAIRLNPGNPPIGYLDRTS
jgi:hypothetical protein